MPRRCEAHALDEEAKSRDQSTQADETTNSDTIETAPPAPAQVEQGTQTEPTPSWMLPFNKEEWKAPVSVLSKLPHTVKTISLDIELEGTAQAVEKDLAEGLPWRELEEALLKLPKLEKVSIRRVKERFPFFVQWATGQHDLIMRELPALRDKKMLNLHW